MSVLSTAFRQTLKRPAAKKPSALKALLSMVKLIYSPFSGLVFNGSQMALASGSDFSSLLLCDTISSFLYNESCS